MTVRSDLMTPRSPSLLHGERGVGLMEVIVATVIATVAILALAYSFGTGRGLINRFEVARMALAAAQSRMEWLATQPPYGPDLAIGSHGPKNVVVDGRGVAQETWTVTAYDDPVNGAGQQDMKRVTVTESWGQGGPNERVQLTRLFPLY